MFSYICMSVLVAQSCLILCDPMDCSLPGSSVHGLFQGRMLELDAISFSKAYVNVLYRTEIISFNWEKESYFNR